MIAIILLLQMYAPRIPVVAVSVSPAHLIRVTHVTAMMGLQVNSIATVSVCLFV